MNPGATVPEPVDQGGGVDLTVIGQVECHASGTLHFGQAAQPEAQVFAGASTLFWRQGAAAAAQFATQLTT
ncbi:hypothetical protein AM506_21635 [Rossellomorea vietnamensis]|uniref:Uncharacterized protein n=1 Tax=Rossellomorea vietnamensis TaxID=218284 RepID=A0A0P6VXQ4_9BACI|nr:hypothetical protein AM506_21635 [Rossellomorea vietnamensis]